MAYVIIRQSEGRTGQDGVVFSQWWSFVATVDCQSSFGRKCVRRCKVYNPILITRQLIALGFLIGCTFAPNLKTFAGQHIYWGTWIAKWWLVVIWSDAVLDSIFWVRGQAIFYLEVDWGISTPHRTCPQVTVWNHSSKVFMKRPDEFIGTLCRHGHVSLSSPGANGRQIFIIAIAYRLTTFV